MLVSWMAVIPSLALFFRVLVCSPSCCFLEFFLHRLLCYDFDNSYGQF
ncbi:MAG: hypothetical protein RLZZ117_2727 [Cyanobacteriota bacterium]|jgi:hypothetical protein